VKRKRRIRVELRAELLPLYDNLRFVRWAQNGSNLILILEPIVEKVTVQKSYKRSGIVGILGVLGIRKINNLPIPTRSTKFFIQFVPSLPFPTLIFPSN
jgi:hypothetical protein